MNRERLKNLLAEYGKLALMVYLAIFVVVLAGFALAIKTGIKVESAAGQAGLWGAAWVATKVAQPLRILATLALTPLLARLLRRRRLGGLDTSDTNPSAGTDPPSRRA